jgi:hypothetical protein
LSELMFQLCMTTNATHRMRRGRSGASYQSL